MKCFFRVRLSISKLIFVFILSVTLFPEEAWPKLQRPVSFGHNLTATSHLLDSGGCTFGFSVAACGIGEKVSLGTSPWIYSDYNTHNLLMRVRLGPTNESKAVALQLGYFKSYPGGRSYYDMELAWLIYIYSLEVNDHLWLHLNAQAMYFLRDKYPFSLRRPWPDRRREQFNISALNEIHLAGSWYVNFETGILGVAQRAFQVHLGSTLEYRGNWWLAHAGFSHTGHPTAYARPTRRFDYQQFLRLYDEGFERPIRDDDINEDYSVHPEFALQAFF